MLFFFQAEDGIRDGHVTGVQTCALPIYDSQLGRSEPIEDTARVISRMVDLVMIRTFGQERIELFAEHSRVPVINGLTNEYHPCQILADIFTFNEFRGPIADKTVAWIGDGNNMAYTWLQAAKLLGFKLHFSAPNGYGLDPDLIGDAGDALSVFEDPYEACRGAHLVTTDVWTSMGFEDENEARRKAYIGRASCRERVCGQVGVAPAEAG